MGKQAHWKLNIHSLFLLFTNCSSYLEDLLATETFFVVYVHLYQGEGNIWKETAEIFSSFHKIGNLQQSMGKELSGFLTSYFRFFKGFRVAFLTLKHFRHCNCFWNLVGWILWWHHNTICNGCHQDLARFESVNLAKEQYHLWIATPKIPLNEWYL